MTYRGRRCSICANPPARQAVDNAIIAGETVADVVRMYSETWGFSQASCYRHARHRRTPGELLTAPQPESEEPADLIREMISLAADAGTMRRDALARGDRALALRAGDQQARVLDTLTSRLKVDADSIADELQLKGDLMVIIRRAIITRPEVALELADAATYRSLPDLASELREMSRSATEHNANRKAAQ